MARSKSEVELVLQARDNASRTFQQLVEATSDLIAKQQEAGSAFSRTDDRVGALKVTLTDLATVSKQLEGQGRLVQQFKDQAAAVSRADEKSKKLIATAAELRAKIKALPEGADSSKLEAQFEKASAAAQKATATVQKQKDKLAELNAALQQSGIATNDLARAERDLAAEAARVVGAQNQTAASLTRVGEAAKKASQDLKRLDADVAATTARASRPVAGVRPPADVPAVDRVFKDARPTLDDLARATEALTSGNRQLEASFAGVEERSRHYRDGLKQLAAAEQDLRRASGLVDDLRRQGQASAAARDNLRDLIAAARQVKTALAAADSPEVRSALEQRYENLLPKIRAAGQELDKQRNTQSRLRASLAELGLAANDLGSAESRLVAVAGQVRTAQDQTAASLDKVGDAAARSSLKLKRLDDDVAASLARASRPVQGVRAPADVSPVQRVFQDAAPTLDAVDQGTADLLETNRKLEASFASIEDQADQYQASLKQLAAAEQQLLKSGGLVEDLQRQSAAVNNARANLRDLVASLRQLKTAVAEAESPEEKSALQQRYDRLLPKVQAAARELDNQRRVAARLKTSLREAGLGTADLSAEQQRLVAAAGRVRSAQNQVAEALGRVEQKAIGARQGIGGFGGDARRSLSLVQRLRGEILALSAAYVGLFGIGRGIGNVFDTTRRVEGVQRRFSVAFDGNNEQAADELKFVRAEADRLKLSFVGLAEEYSKFLVSLPEGTLNLQEARAVFSNVATAARVLNLSVEDTQGVFKALTQIVSKGAVQMEELKGQIGDRLPGALADFARGIGVSTRQLAKLIEQGEVGTQDLFKFADQLRKKYGEELPAAVQTAQAKLADFQNVVADIELELGQSGFLDELADSLRDVGDEIQKPEFKDGLITLAGLLGDLARAGVFLVQNLDAVKNALLAFVGARALGSLITGIASARVAVAGLTGGLRALGFAGLLASGPAGWVAALIAGIATLAFTATEEAVPGLEALEAKYGETGDAADTLARKTENISRALQNLSVQEALRDLDQILPRLQELGNQEDRLARSTPASGGGAAGALARSELERIRAEKLRLEALQGQIQKRVGAAVRADLNPKEPVQARNLGLSARQLEDLEKSIEKANEKIDDLSAVTLAQKLALIDSEYARLIETASGATEEATRIAQLELIAKASAARKKQIVVAEETRLQDELQRLEDAAANRSKDRLDDRINVIRGRYDQLIADLQAVGRDDLVLKVENLQGDEIALELQKTAADLQQALLQLGSDFGQSVDARIDALRAKYAGLLEDLNTAGDLKGITDLQSGLDRAEDRERFADAEAEINRLLEIRTARLEAINLARETGALSARDARDEIRASLGEIEPQLDVLIDKALAFARGLGDEAAIANLQRLRQELGSFKTEAEVVGDSLQESFAGGATSALKDWITGVKDAGTAFRQFASDFLAGIAEMIVKQTLLNGLQQSQGAGGAFDFLGRAVVGDVGSATADAAASAATDVAGQAAETAAAAELVAGATALAAGSTTLVTGATTLATGAGTFSLGAGVFNTALPALTSAAALLATAATGLNTAAAALIGAAGAQGGSSIVSAVAHTGGIIGQTVATKRAVSPLAFMGALRYHSGGIVGLKPDERASVLQVGEEVLTRNDPRHRFNGGGEGKPGLQPEIRIANYFDKATLIREMLNTPAGVETQLNFVATNRNRIRQVLGV